MSKSQWSLSQARAEMLLRGIPMKVIALLLLLLRVFCKWRPLGSVPLFSWLLASLGGEGCTREELGWDKHWASSEPHPHGGPGILAKSDLRWSTEEKGDPGWTGA